MRHWFGFAGAALAAALMCGGPASAQDFEAQVRGYLDHGMTPHAARDYRPDSANREAIVPLRLGQGHLFVLNLRRGVNYRVYGACDQDCSDLDMEIFNTSGEFIERDIALDDTPFVQVTPSANGRFYVRLWLADCETEPCYAGIRVVSGGRPEERVAETAPAGNAGESYLAQVRALLDQAAAGFANEGFTPIPGAPADDAIPVRIQSEGMRVAYQLRGGVTYRFVAACDSDCTDLDIEVLDPAGRSIAHNYAVDNPTTVDVTAPAAGQYSVRAWLASCSVEPCYTAQRGFVRAAR